MDAVALIGRLLIALVIVLGAMWALARLAQRRGKIGKRQQALGVLARQSLGRNSSVAIVKVMDRAMVVGVTEGHVTLLGDTDLAAVELLMAAAPRHAAPEEDQPRRYREILATPVPSRSGAVAHRSPTRMRTARVSVGSTGAQTSALTGSALSLATWKQTLDAIRSRTVRRR